jgi:hypothetical protein
MKPDDKRRSVQECVVKTVAHHKRPFALRESENSLLTDPLRHTLFSIKP